MAKEGTADAKLASDIADESLDNPTKTSNAADDAANDTVEDVNEEGDDEEGDEEVGADGTPASLSKKKRKSRKKKKKAVADSSTDPASSAPNALQQLQQTRPVAVHDIPSLLQQLGMSAPEKKEGKAQEDYKFWNTQPVPKFKEPNLLQTTSDGEGEKLPEGAILPNEICKKSAKQESEKLVDGFEWCLVDLDNKEELQEFYDLLYNHYVEDTDGSFRFNYSPEFLCWALKPPGWKKEWHIGVRTKSAPDGKKGKLVASITGVPVVLRVRDAKVHSVEINFLAIHRKLRNKRLAPVLIKEITRRCYLNDIYQALYTAGTVLPTPITTCRYFHRSLDWQHLNDMGFSHMPPRSTPLRQKYKYMVEAHTAIKGLRPMKPSDVSAVRELLVKYTERFQLRQEWTDEEIRHFLCSDVSKGVVWAYVVEDNGKITDFISYYLLESTVLKSSKRETIRAAYLYYYATEAAFPGNPKPKAKEAQEILQARLQLLVHDALILANKDKFHVFNALTLLDNPLFLKEEKFEPGDGKLNFYLFNWRIPRLNGGVDANNQLDSSKTGGVGVVML